VKMAALAALITVSHFYSDAIGMAAIHSHLKGVLACYHFQIGGFYLTMGTSMPALLAKRGHRPPLPVSHQVFDFYLTEGASISAFLATRGHGPLPVCLCSSARHSAHVHVPAGLNIFLFYLPPTCAVLHASET